MVTPKAKREASFHVIDSLGLSQRRICNLVGLQRSSLRYQASCKSGDQLLIGRMRELAQTYQRWGCPMIHSVLRREGLVINHKRTQRLYRLEGLTITKRRKRKKRASAIRVEMPKAQGPNQAWSMDFIHDKLWQGRCFRALTIIDDYSKEAPAIEVDTSLSGARVARILDQLALCRGLPKVITVDNGPEFAGKDLDRWAWENKVQLRFIRPGKPVDNAYIESFNGTFRDSCLNLHWFTSLHEAKTIIEDWRVTYNTFRPHSSLGNLTPFEFANQHLTN